MWLCIPEHCNLDTAVTTWNFFWGLRWTVYQEFLLTAGIGPFFSSAFLFPSSGQSRTRPLELSPFFCLVVPCSFLGVFLHINGTLPSFHVFCSCCFQELYEGVLINPYPDLLPDVVGRNRLCHWKEGSVLVPNCKSFLVIEAERKHVRRWAWFQQHQDTSCHQDFFLQGKVLKEIHAILTETLGEHALSYATVKNWVTQFKMSWSFHQWCTSSWTTQNSGHPRDYWSNSRATLGRPMDFS